MEMKASRNGKDMTKEEYSVSPSGEQVRLPSVEDDLKEFERLKRVVNAQRTLGRDCVRFGGRK